MGMGVSDDASPKATQSQDASNASLASAAREIGSILQNANLNSQRDLKLTTAEAKKTQEDYLKTAVKQQKLGTEQARALDAPYRDVGYGALDRYMDTLGMTRPEVGSKAIADSLYKEAGAASARAELTEQAHLLDKNFPMWSSGVGNFKGSNRAVANLDQAKNVVYRINAAGNDGPNLIPTIPFDSTNPDAINAQAMAGQSAYERQAANGGIPGGGGGGGSFGGAGGGGSGGSGGGSQSQQAGNNSWLGKEFVNSTNGANYLAKTNTDVMGGLQQFLTKPGDISSTGPLDPVAEYILGRMTPDDLNRMQDRTPLDFVDEFMKSTPYQLGNGYIFPGYNLPGGLASAMDHYYSQTTPAWSAYNELMKNYSPRQQKISEAYNMGYYSPTVWKDVTY